MNWKKIQKKVKGINEWPTFARERLFIGYNPWEETLVRAGRKLNIQKDSKLNKRKEK